MNLLEFLKDNPLSALTEQFGISVKHYDDRVVLNYDQIESPKTHPIVIECRGIIIDKQNNVICRPFDRFFNLGEAPETQSHLDMTKAVAFEKVDGSLIKVYNFQGKWEIATRGTAFAESNCNGFEITFRELVLKALGTDEDGFQQLANKRLDSSITYCFEVTAMENRVVTRYEGYKLHYLGSRVTATGEYTREEQEQNALSFGAEKIRQYNFKTHAEAVNSANTLGGLQEGFVVWQDGKPVAKIKSEAYVAVHHIRGEGLTPKRIAELVLSGEEDEYLTYFSEDAVHITPYVFAYERLLEHIKYVWHNVHHIESQKEFAIEIKDVSFSPALFTARKLNKNPVECFNASRVSWKVDILKGYVS